MKRFVEKFVPLLLIIVAFLLVMERPVVASECTVLDNQVKITDTLNNVSGSGTQVTVKAENAKGSTVTNTLTITNNTESAATIYFAWSANGSAYTGSGSIEIDGTKYSQSGKTAKSGTFTKNLEASSSIEVKVSATGKSYAANTVTLTFSNFTYTAVSNNCDVTISHTDGGIVTIGNETVISGTTYNVSAIEGATLVATINSGYSFLGWIDENGAYLSAATSYTITPSADISIKAVFVNNTSDVAWFLVDDTYLVDNLSTASARGKKIVLINNGVLTGEHSVASGDTLLIPYDAANTVVTDTPTTVGDDPLFGADESHTAPYAYRTLTMAEDAKLTINGAMSVAAKMYAADGGEIAGVPNGPVGFVKMRDNSELIVNGTLYAWGYIIGSGSVTANSTSTVYECFQVAGWRGGNVTKNAGNGVFPASQYYVQNIEVPITYYAGATEIGAMAVSLSLGYTPVNKVNFIGSSNSMFTLSSGSITKDYIENKDRLYIETNDATITVSSIVLNAVDVSASVDSADYILPLTHNMTISLNSSSVICNQNLSILPGAILNIGTGSIFKMGTVNSAAANFYIYDSDEWGTYSWSSGNKTFIPLTSVPGRTGTRTVADLVDAEILVNGTLDANGGCIYTTAGGANIYSTSSTGKVVNTVGTESLTHQMLQDGTSIEYADIEITAAKLLSGDGGYVKTSDSCFSPNTYTYIDRRWVCENHTDVNTDHTCDVCGYVTECVDDNSTDHICDICGKAFLFDIYATSIAVADSLDMYFYIKTDDLIDGIVTGDKVSEGYYAQVTRVMAGQSLEQGETVTIKSSTWSVKSYNDVSCVRFNVDDIAAKEMTDEFTVVIYKGDGTSEGTQVSEAYTESVRKYAIRTFDANDDEALRTALMNLLYYGAECQKYFEYNYTENDSRKLANYNLKDDYTKYVTTAVPKYDTVLTTNSEEGGPSLVATSVSAKNHLMYTFYFENLDVANMKAFVTYNGQTVEVTEFVPYGNWRGIDVSGISMAHGRKELSYEIQKKDGTVVASGTDSIASYVGRVQNSAYKHEVFDALLRFSDSAKIYVGE